MFDNRIVSKIQNRDYFNLTTSWVKIGLKWQNTEGSFFNKMCIEIQYNYHTTLHINKDVYQELVVYRKEP